MNPSKRLSTTLVVVTMFAFYCLGNYHGDRVTLRDCAEKGEAPMFGGDTIKCEVIREQ